MKPLILLATLANIASSGEGNNIFKVRRRLFRFLDVIFNFIVSQFT